MPTSFFSARSLFTKKPKTPGSLTRNGSVDSTSSRLTTRSRCRIKEAFVAPECDLPVLSPEMAKETVSMEKEPEEKIGVEESTLEESAAEEETESIAGFSPVERSPPFQGLTQQTFGLTTGSSFFDDDYLESTFGITIDRENAVEKDVDEASDREPRGQSYRRTIILPSLNTTSPLASPTSPNASLKDELFDRPISISAHPSQSRKRSQGVVLSMIEETENLEALSQAEEEEEEEEEEAAGTTRTRETLGAGGIGIHRNGTGDASEIAVSPRATKVRHKPKPLTGLATAQQSVASIVQMFKPQRTFSAHSIDGMANPPQTPPLSKSAKSASSAGTNEFDAKSDYGHSPSSSMSSMASEASGRFAEFPHPSDTLSPPGPRMQSRSGSVASLHSPDRPMLRARPSVSSLKSTYSVFNVNKPLPPEPGRAPGQRSVPTSANVSRSSSVTVRQRTKSASKAGEDSKPAAEAPSRSDSRSSVTTKLAALRSKYSPREVDELDAASPRFGASNSQPTTSERTHDRHDELLTEHTFTTIAEASPPHSTLRPPRTEPLQVSRGPMRMEPGRKAPLPPSYPPLPASFALASLPGSSPDSDFRKRSIKRAPSSNHVALQMKQSEHHCHRRASSVVARTSINKANRVLGKTSNMPPVRPGRRGSFDSTWSQDDSASLYSRSDLPTEDNELEGDATLDANFEEIRERLELLSPKDDPSLTFQTFHQNNSTVVTVARAELFIEPVPRFTVDQYKAREQPRERLPEIKIHEHIAELEAQHAPSPVELDGTRWAPPVDLLRPHSAVYNAMATSSLPTDHAVEEAKDPVNTAAPKPTSSQSVRSAKSKAPKHCSLASIAMSDIPDLHDTVTPSSEETRPSLSPEEVEELISADAAEHVLLRILQSLDDLKDLFATAEVSRGFYRTFKKNELSLLRNALWKMSPAAWELREVSLSTTGSANAPAKYRPNLYFRHYVRDLLAMVKLKAMILDHCKSFLRQDTIAALAGETERSPIIDDAFWRVWTFCQIFGCGQDREDDIVGQMDWLRGGPLARQSTNTRTISLLDNLKMNTVLYHPPSGFAQGNAGGLTAEELYDMTEIWNCMGVLVAGYLGRRQEAREYGIFDLSNIPRGDAEKENQTLEEWTHYLLTLTPATILDVTSPATPTHKTFAHVRSLGYTHWIAPSASNSRSNFLKEAVSRVYQERMALQRPAPIHSPSFSSLQVADDASSIATSRSTTPTHPAVEGYVDPSAAARQRCAQHAVEIRAKRNDVSYRDVPISSERPMSNYPEVLAALDSLPAAEAPAVPKLPSLVNKLSFRMPQSVSSVFPSPPGPRSSSRATRAPPLLSTANAPNEARRGKRVKHSARPPTDRHPSGTDSPTLPVDDDPFAAAAAAALAASTTSSDAQPTKDRASRMSSLRRGLAAATSVTASSSPSKRTHRTVRSTEIPTNSSIPPLQTRIQTPIHGQTSVSPSASIFAPIPVATMIIDDEKQLVEADSLSAPLLHKATSAVLDPVDLAIQRLVSMGFEVGRVKAALAASETGHAVDAEKALAKLMREREKKRRLDRLDRMG